MFLHAISLLPLSFSFILGQNALLFSRKFTAAVYHTLPNLLPLSPLPHFATFFALTSPKLHLISHLRPPYTNLSSLAAFFTSLLHICCLFNFLLWFSPLLFSSSCNWLYAPATPSQPHLPFAHPLSEPMAQEEAISVGDGL